MAPFSVADLKQRASQVKTSGLNSYASTRDKFISTPSSTPSYQPPRPTHSTHNSQDFNSPSEEPTHPRSSKPPPPPPPPSRGTRPTMAPQRPPVIRTTEPEEEQIDWANLTPEDKEIFFAWLDEFFARYLGKPVSSFAPAPLSTSSSSRSNVTVAAPKPVPARALAPPPVRGTPSPANASTSPRPPVLPRRTTTESLSVPQSPDPSPSPPLPPRRSPSPAAPPMPPRRNSSQAPASSPPMSPRRQPSQAGGDSGPPRRSMPPSPNPSAPPMPPRRQSSQASLSPSPAASPVPPSAPPRRTLPPPAPAGGPPKIKYSTRPSAQAPAPPTSSSDLQMSYPSPCTQTSNAHDLAFYFSSAHTPWGPSDTWYTSSSPLPPLPAGVPQSQIRWAASTRTGGGTSTLIASIVFADLSACYFRVTHPTSRHDPSDGRVRREAFYTPRPRPPSGDMLSVAAAIYGEEIACFAESYAGTGQYVSRGECWDLAHKALEAVTTQYPQAIPIPSLGRTHGCLIYCGRPGEGRWRGGDDRVRRGDVVEWNRVRIEHGLGWSVLGDPDHTAVIVEECVPSGYVGDGVSLPPDQLGTLVVVEQSVGSPPKRASYTLSGMTMGEVWIYRPVGMREYLGFEFEVEPPPGAPVMTV